MRCRTFLYAVAELLSQIVLQVASQRLLNFFILVSALRWDLTLPLFFIIEAFERGARKLRVGKTRSAYIQPRVIKSSAPIAISLSETSSHPVAHNDAWWDCSLTKGLKGRTRERSMVAGRRGERRWKGQRFQVCLRFAHGWYRCSLFRGSARRCNSNIHDSLLTTINIWSIVHTRISLIDNARHRLAAANEITRFPSLA